MPNNFPRSYKKALLDASKSGDYTTIKALLHVAGNINQPCRHDGASALFIACEYGLSDLVRALIADGADVNSTIKDGATPLYIASQEGYCEIAEQLLHARALPNMPCHDGATPIIAAARYNHVEMIVLLKFHGADINHQNIEGTSALHAAAERGNLKSIQTLLASGAIPDIARPEDGVTPLYLAAEEGHTDIAKELVNKGANPEHKCTDDGTTPLDAAKKYGNAEIVRLLQKLPPTFQERLDKIGCKDIPELFIDATSLMVIENPVTLSNGQTHDLESLHKIYFKLGKDSEHFVCPLTQDKISKDELKFKTNVVIKAMIESFVLDKEKEYAESLKKSKIKKKKSHSNLKLFDTTQPSVKPNTLVSNTDEAQRNRGFW